ncbi:solute carrier family 22 member 13-like isoform X4 [Acanthochromis polyacanthus]|uniref:solute carrier family 22 member 13-like isoform X4 n=1 Tax=Acanthochromis polyacanthus TaxID=80966 RepID=UPI0022340157|nr:solute carrier family 22 member 13-like isoform X4 [Acanthochromis polyacanthus]
MVDFGEILRNIGEFGLFQKINLIALCFPNIIQSFAVASFIFVESDPERHCNTDWILSAGPNLTTEEQLNLTLPREEDGSFSRCRMFVPVDWDIDDIRENGLNETSGCVNGWVYGNMLYDTTIVTDFDLVCGRGNMLQVLQTVGMAGIVVGFLIFGPAAESFGRKRATQIPAVMMLVFMVTTAFCPNVYLYLVSQFLAGIAFGGYRVNCIVLTTEWIGASKRSWGVGVTQLFGAIGQCVLAGFIYGIRKWRLAQLISATPLVLTVVYIWFIPESARWLLNRGRTEEAKKLIIKAAAINKRPIPDSLLEEIKVTNSVNEGGIKLIFGSRLLTRYFFVVSLAWFSLNISIFSLYFNMANLGLSIFVTQLLFGVFEVPALLLSMWLLEILGRKILFTAVLLIGGLCSMLILAVPESYPTASTCLAVASRVCMIFMASVCAVYMQELFPTSVRQSATALGSMAGKVGSILAPLLNMLSVYHWAIPISVLSSVTIISGALGLLLPETRNKELPETASDAEGNRARVGAHIPEGLCALEECCDVSRPPGGSLSLCYWS